MNNKITTKCIVEQMINHREDEIVEGINIISFNLTFNYILKEQEINSAYENYKEIIKLFFKEIVKQQFCKPINVFENEEAKELFNNIINYWLLAQLLGNNKWAGYMNYNNEKEEIDNAEICKSIVTLNFYVFDMQFYSVIAKLMLKNPTTGNFDVKETQDIITYNQD